MGKIYNDITETIGNTPLVQLKRTENKGKTIVAIVPSSSERYLSTWLFANVTTDADDISALISAQ